MQIVTGSKGVALICYDRAYNEYVAKFKSHSGEYHPDIEYYYTDSRLDAVRVAELALC